MKKLCFILLSVLYIYLLAFDFFPAWTIWAYFGFLALYITLARTSLQAVCGFFLALPFFFALPNQIHGSFSMWRPLVILLFIRVFIPRLIGLFRAKKHEKLSSRLQGGLKNLFCYEKVGLLLAFLALLSLLGAEFPMQGLGQIVFLVNASLIYLIVQETVKAEGGLVELVKSLAWSSGTIVALGYLQLILSLFLPFYNFWQFWATQISNLYFGRAFSNVLTFSNSWFSKEGGTENLRMFSVMPSSHAFAMTAVFFLCFAASLLALRKKRKKIFPLKKEFFVKHRSLKDAVKEFWTGRMPIWYALRFSGLAVILSGTRGMWVGMIPAFVVSIFLWWRKTFASYAKLWILVMLLIIFFFAISPFINLGLHHLRMSGYRENFLERATSIYDLEEESNVGRLQIWKESLRYAVEHPLGVGYGNFISTLTRDNQSFEQAGRELNKRYNLPQKYITAHSLYLQLLVELSLLGLVLFLVLWFNYFYKVYLYLVSKEREQTFEGSLVFGLSLIFLWFLAYSVFDLTWLNDKILLYTFAGLGLVKIVLQKHQIADLKQ